ncbi:MAG: J domain-containing protein [Candidatus Dormibacteraeota bacterium]|nr:J domain-containing protein [Candidatus Dormibacteraeota bacterium]
MLGLIGRPKLATADRDRLLGEAIRMHREMADAAAVIAALEAGGAPEPVALALNAQAQAQVDRELASMVPLPPSAQRAINYYFLLGITPGAAPDQVHRAYRRKAKEIHPDRHAREFRADQWEDLMTVVTDASDVLSDPLKRRAYDVFWRERSHSVAMLYRKPGEKRGDLETRFLWRIAEMAELEESMGTILAALAQTALDSTSAAVASKALAGALDQYEAAMIEIRTQAHALPDGLDAFADRVRAEMQRKERLVRCLRQLPVASTATDLHALAGQVGPAQEVLAEIRLAQNSFELGSARPFI